MIKNIFEIIDSLYEEYIDVWEDVCNIESPTDYKKGVDAVGDYFAEKAKKFDWRTERFSQPVSGDVAVITMNPDADAAPICLSGHMDTVYPLGFFGNPPVRRDEEKIYGPGVVDCKGGLVCAFLSMHALEISGFKSRPVMLLLQSDEENGSRSSDKATINYICARAKNAVAFLNLEGHGVASNELCLKRKGILTFEFSVKGVAVHSSQCARCGSNAILEAAHKIIEIEKIKDHEGLTCSVNIINGGTAVNTVADSCTFKVNVRYATKEQAEWIEKFAKDLASRNTVDGCTTTVKTVSRRAAMEIEQRNLDLLEKINEIFEKNELSPYFAGSRTGGSDAADVTVAGIPVVDNIGAEGSNIHSPNEYGILESLKTMAKRIAAICAEI